MNMTANCYIKYRGCHKHLFNDAGREVTLDSCLQQLIFCSMCTEVLLKQRRTGVDLEIWLGGLTLFATPLIYLQHLFSKFHYQLGSPGG